MSNYDDIINLPHHISKKHPQMPIADRAAQFSPFAALTGYDAAVRETARLTTERIELDENAKADLDMKLSLLKESLSGSPQISVIYFVADQKKAGGEYITINGSLKRIDVYEGRLVMEDGREIPIEDIMEIESSLFNTDF